VLQPPAISNAPLDPNAPPPRAQPLPNQVPGTITPQAPQQAPSPQWEVPQQQAAHTAQPPGTVQNATPPSSNPRLVRIKKKSNKAENGKVVEGAFGPAGLRGRVLGLRTGRPKAELLVLGAPWTDECLTDERGGPA
jgi:hypothetical protein